MEKEYQQIFNGFLILFLIVDVMILSSLVSEKDQNSSLYPVNANEVSIPTASPTSTITITPVNTITPIPKPTPTPIPADKGYVNIFYMNNQRFYSSMEPVYVNLVNPPLIIDFNVTPMNMTLIRPNDYKVMSTSHHENFTEILPFEGAQFKVTVKDRNNGDVFAEEGYGGEYGLVNPVRFNIKAAGNYTILATGQYVNVTLSMQLPKGGNIPA